MCREEESKIKGETQEAWKKERGKIEKEEGKDRGRAVWL